MTNILVLFSPTNFSVYFELKDVCVIDILASESWTPLYSQNQ